MFLSLLVNSQHPWTISPSPPCSMWSLPKISVILDYKSSSRISYCIPMGHRANFRPWLSILMPYLRNLSPKARCAEMRDAVHSTHGGCLPDKIQKRCVLHESHWIWSPWFPCISHIRNYWDYNTYEFTCHNLNTLVSINLLHFNIHYDWFSPTLPPAFAYYLKQSWEH